MTYIANETGVHTGAPIELYRFAYGTSRYLYTSGDVPYTYNSEVYPPGRMSRGSIESSSEMNRLRLELTVPRDLPVAGLFLAGIPGVVSLTVFRVHRADTGNDTETIVVWKGRVASVEWHDIDSKITCEPIYSSLLRSGLREMYQKLCRHTLYRAGCSRGVGAPSEADPAFYNDVTVLTAIGNVITVAPMLRPDGYYVGGYVKFGDNDMRMVRGHTGQTLTLLTPIYAMQPGDTIRVFAGCDHALATCRSKFNNLHNFGGFPWIPSKNPFHGDGINV